MMMMMMMMMMIILMMMTIMVCAVLRPRIANRVGEDSCGRGGIVNTQDVCSCAHIERPNSSTALWRFLCKYFKQSKWPFMAAFVHAVPLY